MLNRNERQIPRPVLGVVSQLLAEWNTHSDLDIILDSADAPDTLGSTNKPSKVRNRLDAANALSKDPLGVLGLALEEFMEADFGPNEDKEDARKRIQAQLAKSGMAYEQGGTIGHLSTESFSMSAVELKVSPPPPSKGNAMVSTLPNLEPTPACAPGAINGESSIRVFFSHSSQDLALVGLLTDLVKEALHLEAAKIRCSSLGKFALNAGEKTSETILDEIGSAPVFIAVLTKNSIDSFYVISELGARWMSRQAIVPILSPTSDFEHCLKGPFVDLNGIRTNDRVRVQKVLEGIAQSLNRPLQPSSGYEAQLSALVNWSDSSGAGARQQGNPAGPESAFDSCPNQ